MIRWRRQLAATLPFVMLTALYLLSALRVIGVAGVLDPALLYWHDWQDQSLYVRSATALAAGDLTPTLHYYPLLYPLLGLPFLRLWSSQPFFVADLACYLLAFQGFRWLASAAFGFRTWPALIVFAATTLAQFAIAKHWIEPWTSTPAAALLLLALGATARLWTAARSRRPYGIVLGVTLGLMPFARPGDVVVGAIIAASAALAMLHTRDRRTAAETGLAFCIALALPGALYVAIYGVGPSPYMLYSAQYGFNFAWLGWKAYVVLVDPSRWFGPAPALLAVFPWLLIGACGILATLLRASPRTHPARWTAAIVAVTYSVLILAYVDLLPSGLWRFNNLHYFKWVFPVFGLFALAFVRDALRRPTTLIIALPVLLAVCIKLDPVAVGITAPARMVVFPTPQDAEWIPTYFATAWLSDARGEQRNSFDYHQILLPDGVHVVALRRPFAGDERWIGDDHVRAQLEGRPTGGFAPLYMTGPWPKQAVARYGMRVSFGPPCWFWGRKCPVAT